MKRFFTSLTVLCAALTVNSQGIYNNGAFIVMSGAAHIYVDGAGNGDYLSTANGRITPSAAGIVWLEGDWTNNAGNTGFTADAGTVNMHGLTQSINGSASTTFYNLGLTAAGTTSLNVNTFVGGTVITTGVLALGNGALDLNSRMVTITNPAGTAITYNFGFIRSETNASVNPSIVRWQMGVSTGIHVYPFGTAASVQIPFTFNKIPATSATVDVATRPTTVAANTPWAGTVTHMFDPTLAQDGADEAVIDRWWEVTSSAAITANVIFSYRGAENTMSIPYNTGNVGCQFWAGGWLTDNAAIGSTPAALAGVGTHSVAGLAISNAYTPWVLSSVAAPLPVELVSFNSECAGNAVTLSWTTASEQNNNYFTVERSDDGANFRSIGTVAGAGNSSQTLSYSLTDTEPTSATTYYRLRQTDYNGQFTISSLIVQEQCGNGGETVGAFSNGSDVTINIFTPSESNYTVTVYDLQGKLIATEKISAGIGSNQAVLNGFLPAVGVYMINITGDSGIQYADKLYFQK